MANVTIYGIHGSYGIYQSTHVVCYGKSMNITISAGFFEVNHRTKRRFLPPSSRWWDGGRVRFWYRLIFKSKCLGDVTNFNIPRCTRLWQFLTNHNEVLGKSPYRIFHQLYVNHQQMGQCSQQDALASTAVLIDGQYTNFSLQKTCIVIMPT